jgi:siderophore synthetase component
LAAGEIAVPATALAATDPVTGRPVLAGIVRRYCVATNRSEGPDAALAFAGAYARLLLPALLRLVGRYGIAFEAHLQNCVPTFVDGVPHRMALRDFAGLRIHPARLGASGIGLRLWPGSVVGSADLDVVRAKLGYTALQAHLGELVIALGRLYGLDEAAAWREVRGIVDQVTRGSDHAFFTAPTMPHKALVRMRLAGTGDRYVPVANPLAARRPAGADGPWPSAR